MRSWLPYPLLTFSLTVMWVLLHRPSLGHVLLGGAIAVAATWALARLQPAKPRLRNWLAMPRLLGIVLYDIVRSNIAVAGIILQGGRVKRTSGFIVIPLDLRDRTGLSVLAVIVTATPGTAWVEFDPTHGRLLLHVFDLVDEAEWQALIKHRYERLLLEIFE
ncbi:MAG TPA: Na+/H+ antiporter subunit E [Geminicoccus sp.]|uniref:Na+/H+ antiporter subunit E n=1 Tax=Geminicoccus sp. TaxID=2024832 RepID=UPI002C3B152C|nr:Na+/H+ antiporter subunit E [Geminicoccus sp.]HWL67893.1 Na+/H+ antiporter subunit E [Geminicoccus sp.]